jgi:hypothetical protein
MKTMLSLLAAFAAILAVTPSPAATVPVTVTVNSVRNISAGDTWSQPPDFYARIWIEGSAVQTPTVQNSNGFTSPAGWTFTFPASRAKRGGFAPVRIQLFDADDRFESPNGDPMVDIDPAGCSGGFPFGCAEAGVGTTSSDSFGIDVTLNLFNGSWAPIDPRGDSTMGPAPTPGVGQMACTTGSGQNVANVCFTITVGAPSAETLTVRKTTDSDRAFCAPTDCSLREAITRAESGDTVQLPAAASPYLLDAHGDVHLAIRQPLLTVQGPTNGGTAVIRQTRGDFRAFDVHGGAKLVMRHVTVTGGGAGNSSTAYSGHIHGGGIHNHGTIELTHVTITGNRALDPSDTVGGGGGIYNATGATATLTNVTIAGNITGSHGTGIPLGGGIAGPGTYTLRNTVIANNTVAGSNMTSNCGLGGGLNRPMNIVNAGGNLQYPGSDCGFLFTRFSKFGPGITYWRPYFATAAIDPLLPFDTQRGVFVPLARGPAVDIGVPGCGPTDQAGRSAPADGSGYGIAACDAGAIESP